PLAVALKEWRSTAARASRCAPQAVLTDAELERLVRANPQNDIDIVAVLGPIIGGRYSARILAAIADQ
ncbi:MAG: HRDC domain-containing protein, partial [Actinomycetota bacterium]